MLVDKDSAQHKMQDSSVSRRGILLKVIGVTGVLALTSFSETLRRGATHDNIDRTLLEIPTGATLLGNVQNVPRRQEQSPLESAKVEVQVGFAKLALVHGNLSQAYEDWRASEPLATLHTWGSATQTLSRVSAAFGQISDTLIGYSPSVSAKCSQLAYTDSRAQVDESLIRAWAGALSLSSMRFGSIDRDAILPITDLSPEQAVPDVDRSLAHAAFALRCASRALAHFANVKQVKSRENLQLAIRQVAFAIQATRAARIELEKSN